MYIIYKVCSHSMIQWKSSVVQLDLPQLCPLTNMRFLLKRKPYRYPQYGFGIIYSTFTAVSLMVLMRVSPPKKILRTLDEGILMLLVSRVNT